MAHPNKNCVLLVGYQHHAGVYVFYFDEFKHVHNIVLACTQWRTDMEGATPSFSIFGDLVVKTEIVSGEGTCMCANRNLFNRKS